MIFIGYVSFREGKRGIFTKTSGISNDFEASMVGRLLPFLLGFRPIFRGEWSVLGRVSQGGEN